MGGGGDVVRKGIYLLCQVYCCKGQRGKCVPYLVWVAVKFEQFLTTFSSVLVIEHLNHGGVWSRRWRGGRRSSFPREAQTAATRQHRTSFRVRRIFFVGDSSSWLLHTFAGQNEETGPEFSSTATNLTRSFYNYREFPFNCPIKTGETYILNPKSNAR